MPIRELVEALGEADRPRFVVVDGAQAVNHVPLRLAAEYCDLLLTGCHKWLRAYHPLGLAVCCRAATEGLAMAVCREMFSCGELDDPLWSFATQLETERLESFSETVNLAPLFTAAAAVRAMIRSGRDQTGRVRRPDRQRGTYCRSKQRIPLALVAAEQAACGRAFSCWKRPMPRLDPRRQTGCGNGSSRPASP